MLAQRKLQEPVQFKGRCASPVNLYEGTGGAGFIVAA